MRRGLKIFFIAAGCLVIALGVFLLCMVSRFQQIEANPEKVFQSANPAAAAPGGVFADALDRGEPGMIAVSGRLYRKKPEILSILFLGIDSNAERSKHEKNFRSDMIMVCALDLKNNSATLISIPRDTYTDVYRVDYRTGAVTGSLQNKINSAFAYGYDKYAYQNAIRTIEHFMNVENTFSLELRYYAAMDIDGIAKIADALGGVTVTLEEDFPGIGTAGQTVNLRGNDAIHYVRERKNLGGDIGRTRRQQLFVMAIAKKVQAMGAIKAAPLLFEQISVFTATNLNLEEAAALAIILEKMNTNDIRHLTLPGETAMRDEMSVILVDPVAVTKTMLETYYEPYE